MTAVAAQIGETRRSGAQFAGMLAAGALVLLAFTNALTLAARLAQTSDSAQGFVTGYAVAKGNLLLAGWHFPFNDYYFTDTLPYAVLETILGPRPWLMAAIPALAYALFLAAALFVCLRAAATRTDRIESAAVLALLLGAPVWIGGWDPLFLSDMHTASVVGGFAALVLCARLSVLRKAAWWTGAVVLVALAAALVASDPFVLVFAFGPALAVLGFEALASREARAALAMLALGTALGCVLPHLVAAAGGLTTAQDVVTRFVPAPLFGRNLLAILAGLLRLFGIVVPGRFGAAAAISLPFHALGLGIAAPAFLRAIVNLRRAPLLDRMLCAAIVAVVVACAVSQQFGKGIVPAAIWEGGPPMRYLVPVFLFAAVLAARQIPRMLARASAGTRNACRIALITIATLATVAGSWLSGALAQPLWIPHNTAATAARWLEQHGLTQGVGEYWSANLVSALSGNMVQIRSVVSDGRRLVPYVWVEDARRYARPPQFAIWQEPNRTGVTEHAVRATWPVCATARVGGFLIATLRAARKCPVHP